MFYYHGCMPTIAAPASTVWHALLALTVALDGLVSAVDEGGLEHFDDEELVEFLQDFERVRNRLPLVDHRALRDAADRKLAEALCQGRLSRVLIQALRLNPGEANRRVRAAEELGGQTSMLGQPLAPRRPVLAAAQRDGTVTPDQAHLILAGLAKVDRPGFDPADVQRGEETLTGLAATLGPKDLQVCVDRFVDHLDPDGSVPQEELNAHRRNLELRRQRDGSWRGELRLTGTLGAKLQAVLGPLAKPRVSAAVDDQGCRVEEIDVRTYGQRLHDALEDVCDRTLRAGGMPDAGGVPATVIVTIDEESLRRRTGAGTTSDGTRLSVHAVLALAEQAEIVPAVLSKSGAVLTLGRGRRIASKAQALALVARDRGCSFPGCSHPPEWCERHHIRAWVDGGRTDLDNLTLLCRYHHHNFAARGWACRLNLDGLPEWVPPRYVDRTQTPLVNGRIRAALDPALQVA
jgi:Domain of unknown function (DUF222)/HNH endonuclease